MSTAMQNEYHDFQLSPAEAEYLNRIVSRDSAIVSLIRFEQSHQHLTVRLTTNQAEKLRDYLTTQLASTGFDKNYSPTREGQMLEMLIDRFYSRNTA